MNQIPSIITIIFGSINVLKYTNINSKKHSIENSDHFLFPSININDFVNSLLWLL